MTLSNYSALYNLSIYPPDTHRQHLTSLYEKLSHAAELTTTYQPFPTVHRAVARPSSAVTWSQSPSLLALARSGFYRFTEPCGLCVYLNSAATGWRLFVAVVFIGTAGRCLVGEISDANSDRRYALADWPVSSLSVSSTAVPSDTRRELP